MSQTITVDGDEVIDATIDGEAVEEITIDGVLAWAAEVGLDGLTVTRQDGSYTENNNDHVVSNGGKITLPSPVQDGIVMITKVETRPELTGTVDGISEPYISGDESAVFVSDGNEWYSVDRNQLGAIPDSAVYYYSSKETAVSTGSVVDPWADLVGNVDLDAVGSPTLQADALNGVDAIDLGDNTQRGFDYPNVGLSEPATVIWGYHQDGFSGFAATWWEGREVDEILNDAGSNQWLLSFDGNKSTGGSSVVGDLIVTLAVDSSDAILRVNGSQVASVSSSPDVGVLTSGHHFYQADEPDRHVTGFGGIIVAHDERLQGSDLDAEEERVASELNMDVLG